jgi:cell wall-associated NlpC family hydrolase
MSLRSGSRLLAFALAGLTSTLVLALPATAGDGSKGFRSGSSPRGEVAEPSKGEQAVNFALGMVGTPYRWAGESPTTGFDCSGLVRWAYGRVGIDVPHSSYALYDVGRRVSVSRMQPGDIVFFSGLGHVGLYVGKGRMVHSPETGRNVEVVQLSATGYGSRLVGARRVVPA